VSLHANHTLPAARFHRCGGRLESCQ
jgi:hypothetical protein